MLPTLVCFYEKGRGVGLVRVGCYGEGRVREGRIGEERVGGERVGEEGGRLDMVQAVVEGAGGKLGMVWKGNSKVVRF